MSQKEPRREGKGDGFRAYYYGFIPTGVEFVDRILKAVAGAGATAHNTNGWTEEWDNTLSARDSIQFVANEVAKEIKEKLEEKTT